MGVHASLTLTARKPELPHHERAWAAIPFPYTRPIRRPRVLVILQVSWGEYMSLDLVLRTLGTMTCVYSVGLFVAAMSVSSLNAAIASTGPFCGAGGCMTAAYESGVGPAPRLPVAYDSLAFLDAG